MTWYMIGKAYVSS